MTPKGLPVPKSRASAFPQYDIITYFVPGSTLIFLCGLFDRSINTDLLRLGKIQKVKYEALATELLKKSQIIVSDFDYSGIVIVFIFVLASYLLGIAISTISSLGIERGAIGRNGKYPLQVLFRNNTPFDFQAYLRYLTTFGQLPVSLFGSVSVALSLGLLLITLNSNIAWVIFCVLCILIVLQVLAFLIMLLGHDHTKEPDGNTRIILGLIYLPGLPVQLAIYFAKKLIEANRELPSDVKKLFKSRYKKLTGLEFSTTTPDSFWLTYGLVRSYQPFGSSFLLYTLRSYRFARNMGMSFYLAWVYISSSMIYLYAANRQSFPNLAGDLENDYVAYGIVYFAASVVFTTRFLTLYYNTFSRNLVRMFILIDN